MGKTQFTMKKDFYTDNTVNDTPLKSNSSLKKARRGKAKNIKTKRSGIKASDETLVGKCLVYIGDSRNEIYNKSVIYITESDKDNVRGIMINKLLLGTAALECHTKEKNQVIRDVYEDLYQGGPESPAHGYVLFPKGERSSDDPFAVVHGDIAISTSFGILQDILDGEGPKKKIIAMGHCEWHKGELEWEIYNNQWLIIPSNIDLIFDTAYEDRWGKAQVMSGRDMRAIAQVGLA